MYSGDSVWVGDRLWLQLRLGLQVWAFSGSFWQRDRSSHAKRRQDLSPGLLPILRILANWKMKPWRRYALPRVSDPAVRRWGTACGCAFSLAVFLQSEDSQPFDPPCW